MSHATLCFLSYNRPQFLRIAIGTAIAGLNEPAEIIVHDDGSSDPELLKYLYTIHQKGIVSSVILNAPGINQGQGVALNRMFKMATGDPIVKLDHDLIFNPGWLETAQHILRDERVGLVGLFKYWHEPVDWRKTIITDADLMAAGATMGELPLGYSYHTHICGSAMVIPRRVWLEAGPFDEHFESFGEDWEFQKRVYNQGLFCALPDEDQVENQGFGVGPSTVVVAEDQVQKIHQLPLLVGGQR